MESAKRQKGARLFRETIKKKNEEKDLILYIVEVHEDLEDKKYVNIRHITDNRTNAAFPISMCKFVVDNLLLSKVAIDQSSGKSTKPTFDVKLIPNVCESNSERNYFVEFKESDDEFKNKLLIGRPENELKTDQELPWSSTRKIVLNSLIIGRLIEILVDIMIRYKNLQKLPEAPSFYSSSGGRRFFFDIRETRWGKRMQISQVTDLRRNMIGVPLENLVLFRDRINYLIKELSLEETPRVSNQTLSGYQSLKKNKKPKKNLRKGEPKPKLLINTRTVKPALAEVKANA